MDDQFFKSAIPVYPAGRSNLMNDCILFAAVINAEKTTDAVLKITGSTLYRVKINGKFLSYGPARAAVGFFRVDEVPLRLAAGKNRLTVELSSCCVNSYYYPDQPGFLQAEVVAGEKVLAATGENFRACDLNEKRIRKVPRSCFQRMFVEAYNVSAGPEKFTELTLVEQDAVKLLPRVVPFPEYRIDHSYTPQRSLRRTLSGEKVVRRRWDNYLEPDGEPGFKCFKFDELEFDAYTLLHRLQKSDTGNICSTFYKGRINNTGFIRLKVDCRRPGLLAVIFSETAQADNTIDPVMHFVLNGVFWNLQTPGVYDLEAMEVNTFKYAEVFMVDGEAEVQDFSLREYKSPLGRDYKLPGSDPVLNAIFEAGWETFAANAVDCFTDCPSRERAAWLCDSFFTARTAYLLTGNTLLEKFFLENFAIAPSFKDIPVGALPMVYPGDHPNGMFIPNWGMWLIIQTGDYLKRSGDRELVEMFREKFTGFIGYMNSFLNADGLLENLPSWVFVEWSKANEFLQDVSFPSNMLYTLALDTMAELYHDERYVLQAKQMRQTIRRQSFDGTWFRDHGVRQKDGSLLIPESDITETCQYYAFFTGCAMAELHDNLWNKLITDFGPERKSNGAYPEIYPSNAFIGNYLRLEILSVAGLHEQLLRESVGYFKKMADVTGTLWEYDDPHASCCHGFASYINVLLAKALAAQSESL